MNTVVFAHRACGLLRRLLSLATTRDLAATNRDLAELKSDMQSLRADMAADLRAIGKELGEQIIRLHRAVVDYHTTVIGHGVLTIDLEGRLRRVEQHLDLA